MLDEEFSCQESKTPNNKYQLSPPSWYRIVWCEISIGAHSFRRERKNWFICCEPEWFLLGPKKCPLAGVIPTTRHPNLMIIQKTTPKSMKAFHPEQDGTKTNKVQFFQSMIFWLVVSTHLKNISQILNLPQVGVKIKNIWNHQPVFVLSMFQTLFGQNSTSLMALNADFASTVAVFTWKNPKAQGEKSNEQ